MGANGDLWKAMFDAARQESYTDLSLYRVLVGSKARIEHHVPALPLSRDEQQLHELQKSLAAYRMVFGQSRQEDLVALLADGTSGENVARLVSELRIDLEPPVDVESSVGLRLRSHV